MLQISTGSTLFAWLSVTPALWAASLIISYFIGKANGYKQGLKDMRRKHVSWSKQQ